MKLEQLSRSNQRSGTGIIKTLARSCENVSYVICEQQRRRSACASAQSDQHLSCSFFDSMICILAIFEVWVFLLASATEQPGLNLTWSKISEDTFSRDVAQVVSNQKKPNSKIKIKTCSVQSNQVCDSRN